MKILNRAKSIYSDEYLISEDIKFELDLMYLRINGKWKECDKDTRSINFEDMADSQENKIFASLSEDGKGGDITQLQACSGTCLSCGEELSKTLAVAIYEKMEFREIELNPHKCFTKREHNYLLIGNLEYKKVIGIQE